MDQTEPQGSDWVSAWIEQQRELLRQHSAAAASGRPDDVTDQVRDLGAKWLDLGQSYLAGLAQFAQSGSASGAQRPGSPLKMDDQWLSALRSTWSGAGAEQEGAARRFADVLGRLPPLGLVREHTEAWRELLAAQSECQRLERELNGVFSRVQSDALSLLQQRVREREQSGRAISSYRDLYDLWVECAEHVYAEVAHSDAYCRLQAELGNALMRLRSRQQTLIEHGLKQFDLPTRSELNTVHRQLRELKQKVAMFEARASDSTASPQSPAAAKSGTKPIRADRKTATAKRKPR
jgi:class III poly(R)-hydroxyalkanoic acid synthase PhaE subunit